MKNAAPMQQHYDTSYVLVAVIGRPFDLYILICYNYI